MSRSFPEPRFVRANGVRLAVYEQGAGVPVVFSHGFPELAYSWRHQLPALAAAGFRAIALDQRGYGASDRPAAVEAYDIAQLTGDLAGLLDALGLERAVFCGHDWGGMVIWSMGQLHPSRVLGLIGVNTPFMARPPLPPIQLLCAAVGPEHYIVHFQKPGDADERLAKDVRRVFEVLMRRGIKLADIDLTRGIQNLATAVEEGRMLGQAAAQRRGARRLRARVRTQRLHGRRPLVPQPRPQLATHRARAPDTRRAVADGDVGGRLRPAAGPGGGHGGARPESSRRC
ncbi:MAG: alpha/beta fold hydrolase [Myxococcota bacterium]